MRSCAIMNNIYFYFHQISTLHQINLKQISNINKQSSINKTLRIKSQLINQDKGR